MITIRAGAPSDAEAIDALAREFQALLRSYDPMAHFSWGATQYLRDGFGNDPAFEVLVADDQGRVVGFTLFHAGYDADYGDRLFYMTDLFVTSAYRGRGIGTLLMDQIASTGRQRGVRWIVWSVLKGNTAAIEFYTKAGAHIYDRAHQMVLDINPSAAVINSGG